MGNGDCGQSITAPLCCSFLFTFFPCSSMELSMGCRGICVPAPEAPLSLLLL